jgi:hypothetical protein
MLGEEHNYPTTLATLTKESFIIFRDIEIFDFFFQIKGNY